MASIDSLKQSITELEQGEALKLLLDIRRDRRDQMERRRNRRASKGKKPKKTSKKKLLSTVKGMTKEQKLNLLKELKG